jgi:hypothetical protein
MDHDNELSPHQQFVRLMTTSNGYEAKMPAGPWFTATLKESMHGTVCH